MMVLPLDQSIPSPIVLNQVSTSLGAGLRVEKVRIAGAANDKTNCTSNPCTMYRNTPGITSVGRNNIGDYTIYFAAGTFSEIPACSYLAYGTGAGYAIGIKSLAGAVADSSTTYTVASMTVGAASLESYGDVICVGSK
jgi:hypothetical protein